jgi:cytochrome c peroxidase
VHDVEGTYERIARSISAYEQSAEVNPFSSKYDYYLAGMVELTEQEAWGLSLFNDPDKGNCAACHPSEPGPDGEPPLFTDFTYDNLGVPRNLENPFYTMPPAWNPAGAAWVDLGLGGFLGMPSEIGKVKVPTLRNVDKRPYPEFVKAFAHNGFFKSLEDIVHFYNTRDVEDWPPPEVEENVNREELGDLGLTAEEEAAIVAFMKTLSDGFELP